VRGFVNFLSNLALTQGQSLRFFRRSHSRFDESRYDAATSSNEEWIASAKNVGVESTARSQKRTSTVNVGLFLSLFTQEASADAYLICSTLLIANMLVR